MLEFIGLKFYKGRFYKEEKFECEFFDEIG